MTSFPVTLRAFVATSVIGLTLAASACGSSGSKDAGASRSVPPPPTSPATSVASSKGPSTSAATDSATGDTGTETGSGTGTDGNATWPGGATGDSTATGTGTDVPADNDLYVVTIDVTGLADYDATEREKLVGNRAKEDGLEVVDWHMEKGKIVVAGGTEAVAKVREEKYVTSVDLLKD